MNETKAARVVVVVLLLLGVACVSLRLHSRRGLALMEGDSVWRLTYDVEFQAPKAGTRVRVAVPDDSLHCRLIRQELRYVGLNAERLRPTRSDTRELALVTDREGDFHLSARFDLHLTPKTTFSRATPPVQLTAEERAGYLRATRTIQAEDAAVLDVFRQIQAAAANKADLTAELFRYCYEQLGLGADDDPADAAEALRRGVATPLGKVRVFIALCRAAKVPARLVGGLEITMRGEVKQRQWAEVLADGRWEPYDPHEGFARELPYNYLAARRDGMELVHAPSATVPEVRLSVASIPPPASMGRRTQHPAAILDLPRLPVEMHEALKITLLMPIGALVTAIFRTLIGLRTFGTFTPGLLALAFVFADWKTGLIVLAGVVMLGLITRVWLDRLRLLMVPRLSVILTLVTLCIVLAVSLFEYLGLTKSTQAVMLPMVICTMTVERFFLTSEEDSVYFALQLLAGTLAVGACCYLVLRWEAVGTLLLAFPEIHFFTVAALIAMGRYTGYRLTELWRFRDFGQPPG